MKIPQIKILYYTLCIHPIASRNFATLRQISFYNGLLLVSYRCNYCHTFRKLGALANWHNIQMQQYIIVMRITAIISSSKI